MPELSRFFGIVIYMYYREHGPGHFHAHYGEYEITVEIESGVVTGQFPRRGVQAVLEWYEIHKEDLAENWDRAHQKLPLKPIDPLE